MVCGRILRHSIGWCNAIDAPGGWRMNVTIWIGRIEPSMWFEGAWWQEILPDDVRLTVLSLGVGRLRR